ncbi:MAG TPA: type I restriction endonuclease subunit R [Candidatus Faecisoma merdavium]|nr:type I restriction endonuclease subunit R [Candidatus Faecisoma merdavium]
MAVYESEAKLELRMIEQLKKQGYEYVEINDVVALEKNFRNQINKHNKVELKGKDLSDKEFEKLMIKISGKSIFQSAKELRQKQDIVRDDGTVVYVELFNTKEWCKNIFQITHQTTVEGKYTNRYDVTILINGLPLVQIELKRRGIDMKEAFDQIKRYKNHSFTGLYRYIQLFIISNGIDTKYFANGDQELNYGFTFYWTDVNNDRITNLEQFCTFFLERCHVAKMIARYMIINETDKLLLVMRPYQVYAVENIVDRAINTNNNGYIWHTTGSGKTITSFKTSQILSLEPSINQVFFLVDRKDLDKQTLDEFNKFDPGCVDMTNETFKLVQQIKDSSKPLIITTIQKMANACSNPRYASVMEKYKDKKTIFIIDECHRSQFGDMHKQIANTFTNAQYFGFTGTPRFKENKSQDGRSTADIFEKCLHTYLIKDAIKDGNVLGFSVDYIKTINSNTKEYDDEMVEGIDTDEVFLDDQRISLIAQHIIDHHNIKTRDRKYNALFAVSSIPILIKYYDKFKSLNHNLKIGTIFTYGANENLDKKQEHSRDTLERYIQDYNKMFGTNFTTHNFDSYFRDICKKIKNTEIDIVIVVDMLLTGFDAKRLNTLYVDKPLKYHSLIQAFSRTNRVESETKPHGNIICYDIPNKYTVDEAVKLFSLTDNIDQVIMEPYEVYLNKYINAVSKLLEIAPNVDKVQELEEDGNENNLKEFIISFRDVAKILVSLKTFNEFDMDNVELPINAQIYEDYKSKYYEIYRKITSNKEKASILNDISFSLELIQTDKINVSYIFNLIRNVDLSNEEQKKKDIADIESKLVNITDDELFLKLDLIKRFLSNVLPELNPEDSIDDALNNHMNKEREQEIIKFANENEINLDVLQEVIDEVEYSGIFPNELIGNAINAPFIKKIKLIDNVKIFIKNLLRKYM